MITCKVCGQSFSDGTTICPHCGAPIINFSASAMTISEELVRESIISNKTHVNTIEGNNISILNLVISILIAGTVLCAVNSFIPVNKYVLFENDTFGKFTLSNVINIGSYLLSGLGMSGMYLVLRKAMSKTETPMKHILNMCAIFALSYTVLIATTVFLKVYAMNSVSIYINVAYNITKFGILLCYGSYIFLSCIFARKLIDTYEGSLNFLGRLILVLAFYRILYTCFTFIIDSDSSLNVVLQLFSTIASVYIYLSLKRILK